MTSTPSPTIDLAKVAALTPGVDSPLALTLAGTTSPSRPTPQPEIPVVTPDPDSRLAQLAARYAALKPLVENAKAELDSVVEGIKAELAAAQPGAVKVELRAAGLDAPLRLSAKTGWRLDTPRLKQEAPDVYVQYAVQTTAWELRAVAGASA